ncbi:MAG: preprotein translocase subunit SecG [Acidobacteriota bacterium]
MVFLFSTIHVLICLFLILVVLLQQGKGADLSVFGGGGTMTAFGARGAATLLHKMTVFAFVGFIFTTLIIGVLQKRGSASSVMGDVPVVEEPVATQEGEEAEEIVGALPEDEGPDAEAAEVTADGEASADEVKPEAETFEDSDSTSGDGEDADGSASEGESSTN